MQPWKIFHFVIYYILKMAGINFNRNSSSVWPIIRAPSWGSSALGRVAVPPPGVNFEYFTEVKFWDILLTGMGHRDRRLNRDSPGQTGTYGRSNLNQNLKPKPKFAILCFHQKCRRGALPCRGPVNNKDSMFVNHQSLTSVLTSDDCQQFTRVLIFRDCTFSQATLENTKSHHTTKIFVFPLVFLSGFCPVGIATN